MIEKEKYVLKHFKVTDHSEGENDSEVQVSLDNENGSMTVTIKKDRVVSFLVGTKVTVTLEVE
jgi:hypothetical protein